LTACLADIVRQRAEQFPQQLRIGEAAASLDEERAGASR
jgi:hypothetical protein